MKKLSKLLMKYKGFDWSWEENHINYLNHIINLDIKTFLKKIKALNEELNVLDIKNKEEDDEENDKKDDKKEKEINEDNKDEKDIIS